MTTIHEAAQAYVAAGLSVLPIKPNGRKQPATNLLPVVSEAVEGCPRRGWEPFTRELPSQDYLDRWFGGWANSCGIAVIGRRVSGNLEAIDIDRTELIAPWLQAVRERDQDLLDKLVLVQTPRPGLHCYYRCPTIGGNRKLAQGFVRSGDGETVETVGLIETRGEHGYALIPPSSGLCHPTGRPYLYLTDRTLLDVQEITTDERSLLIELSEAFGETPPPRRQLRHSAPEIRQQRPLDRNKPGDDFSARVSWDDLLESYGWSLWDLTDDGEQYWTRPGKEEGVSASVGYAGADLLYVWTASVEELEQESAYSKFSFLTHMEYGGDFARAAKALREQGYGRQRPEVLRNGPLRNRLSRNRYQPPRLRQ